MARTNANDRARGRAIWRRASGSQRWGSGAMAVALGALATALVPVPVLAESASRNSVDALAGRSDDDLLRQGLGALGAGQAGSALPVLSELAARRNGDSTAQALLALAYHRSAGGAPEATELALAGYDLALRADPDNALAAGLAGRLAFERGRYGRAADLYARAAMADPANGGALLGLAASAYMAGDAGFAALAADRAARSGAALPTRAAALRVGVLAQAALGHPREARRTWEDLARLAPAEAEALAPRLALVERTNAVDAAGSADQPVEAPPAEAVAADQVSVDVAIVLSQNTVRERIGLNLLDGLTLNYSYNNQWQRTRQSSGGSDSDSTQRVITQAIGVPQLSYNLNLFNRGGQYYNVVARPSLTAYRNETSEFFIGRSVKVAISGVNAATLENIDIGIEMKVTPIEITPEGTRVKIEATRSFLTTDAAGRFSEALTTFRQRVSATAQIRFGETLILSGLSERVDDNTFSKTPVLGDLPLVQNLFRQKNLNHRQDAALILVTPSLPSRLPGRAFMRSEHLERAGALWTQVIDPSSNASAVTAQLARRERFTRMRSGDARLTWPDPAGAMPEVLAGLLQQGGQAWPGGAPLAGARR